jgi:hypothetical protein
MTPEGARMIWTAWNDGIHRRSGAGYGFKVPAEDRDRHFKRDWQTVTVELQEGRGVLALEVSIAKDSFWGAEGCELTDQKIGRWLRGSGDAPWPRGAPPSFEVEAAADRRFIVRRRVAPNNPLQRTGATGR